MNFSKSQNNKLYFEVLCLLLKFVGTEIGKLGTKLSTHKNNPYGKIQIKVPFEVISRIS